MDFFRARICHFVETQVAPFYKMEYLPDGVLAVNDGKIVELDSAEAFKQRGLNLSLCKHYHDELIVAGFIDSHVHAPQLEIIASFGEQLLDWLNKYTFPAESKFSDPEYSLNKNRFFLNSLYAHGTTSALVFPTSFKHSVEQLFELAYEKNMRLLSGKIMMDRNAPPALCDTAESSYHDSQSLIDRWHERGRIGYAVTPRFAGTSSVAQLNLAKKLIDENESLWVQTHLSENKAEIDWTQSLFPDASDYLNVYETYGLVNEKSTFAHCIHLTDSEKQRLADAGSNIAFCPSSNLFLGSGLFDLANTNNIAVSLASDVGGGTSLSPFRTMGDAYKVSQLNNYALTASEAFYLSSLGTAKALTIDHEVGNFEKGKMADFVVLKAANHDFLHARSQLCHTIEEELFVYMTLADDRIVHETYIAGKCVYQNPVNTEQPKH